MSNAVRGPIGTRRSTSASPTKAEAITAPSRITITAAPGARSLWCGARIVSRRTAGSFAHARKRTDTAQRTGRAALAAGRAAAAPGIQYDFTLPLSTLEYRSDPEGLGLPF